MTWPFCRTSDSEVRPDSKFAKSFTSAAASSTQVLHPTARMRDAHSCGPASLIDYTQLFIVRSHIESGEHCERGTTAWNSNPHAWNWKFTNKKKRGPHPNGKFESIIFHSISNANVDTIRHIHFRRFHQRRPLKGNYNSKSRFQMEWHFERFFFIWFCSFDKRCDRRQRERWLKIIIADRQQACTRSLLLFWFWRHRLMSMVTPFNSSWRHSITFWFSNCSIMGLRDARTYRYWNYFHLCWNSNRSHLERTTFAKAFREMTFPRGLADGRNVWMNGIFAKINFQPSVCRALVRRLTSGKMSKWMSPDDSWKKNGRLRRKPTRLNGLSFRQSSLAINRPGFDLKAKLQSHPIAIKWPLCGRNCKQALGVSNDTTSIPFGLKQSC